MLDEKYMKRALEIAAYGRGKTSPNPMVGAVIVRENRIIGEGYHEKRGENHAEVNAFESASESVEGATMYVTLEPCSHFGKTPPCADRIIKEKIKKVVIATLDPNPLVAGKGVKKLEEAGIQVVVGVCQEESVSLNEVFMKYIVHKEPFVLMKVAMSMDGKIATRTGDSKWISSEESRNEVQKIRSYICGIMVGIGTVLADNPRLTCRLENGKNPIRIVVDTDLRIPLDALVLKDQDQAKTVIATVENKGDINKRNILKESGIHLLDVPEKNGKVDLKILLKMLGEMEIDSVLLEGGGTLNFSALNEGVIDKVLFYIAPILIGGKEAISPICGEGIEKLAQAFDVKNMKVEWMGNDLRIEGYPERRTECSQGLLRK